MKRRQREYNYKSEYYFIHYDYTDITRRAGGIYPDMVAAILGARERNEYNKSIGNLTSVYYIVSHTIREELSEDRMLVTSREERYELTAKVDEHNGVEV